MKWQVDVKSLYIDLLSILNLKCSDQVIFKSIRNIHRNKCQFKKNILENKDEEKRVQLFNFKNM